MSATLGIRAGGIRAGGIRAASIRTGGADDAAAMAAVIVRAFATCAVRLDPPASALQETAETIAASLADHVALVAERALVSESSCQIVGCVMVKPGATVYVGRLAVDPAWRGRGIAHALIDAAEAYARSVAARAMTLSVRIVLPDNQRLFAACGFREVAREAHPGYAHATFIRMEKVLA